MSCCFDGEAADVWERIRDLDEIARPVDESHFSIALLRCPKCAQRFVKVFCESIDWVNGNDPQAWIVAKISEAEAASLADEAAVRALSPRPWLDVYFPSDGRRELDWFSGTATLMPHD